MLVDRSVLVDAESARWLLLLLQDGRRRARREQWRTPTGVTVLLSELAELVRSAELDGLAGSAQPDSHPEPVSMSTAEAASMLGVSRRRVVALVAEGKLEGRKVAGVWRVDAADVILRLPTDASEPVGTPSEAAVTGSCARSAA